VHRIHAKQSFAVARQTQHEMRTTEIRDQQTLTRDALPAENPEWLI
jgi:hypothetical protein